MEVTFSNHDACKFKEAFCRDKWDNVDLGKALFYAIKK